MLICIFPIAVLSLYCTLQPEIATPIRHTVTVFGDPHLLSYKSATPVTCYAYNWQTYLANEFFILEGFATSAADGSFATYVTEVCTLHYCFPSSFNQVLTIMSKKTFLIFLEIISL